MTRKLWTLREIAQACIFRDNGMNMREIAERLDRTSEGVERKLLRTIRTPEIQAEMLRIKEGKDEQPSEIATSDRERGLTAALQQAEAKIRILQKESDLGLHIRELMRETTEAYLPVPIPKPQLVKSDMVVEDMCLLLSDLHSTEVVSRLVTSGLGEYTPEIMCDRLAHLIDKIALIRSIMKGYHFPRLNILMLGDMMAGAIHEELRQTNAYDRVTGMLYTSNVIAAMIGELAQSFGSVQVYGVVGNHGRLTKKPISKFPCDNWDYLLYDRVSLLLRDQENVKFEFPNAWWYTVNIRGRRILLLHGDTIKAWMGYSAYGVDKQRKRAKDLLDDTPMEFDDEVLGHFHQFHNEATPCGEVIVNGSVIGNNEYANKQFMGGRPLQVLFGVHENHGITWRFPLYLDDAPEGLGKRYTLEVT